MCTFRGATGVAHAPKLGQTPYMAARRPCQSGVLFSIIKVRPRSCWSYPKWGPSYKGVQQVIIFVPDLLFQWKKEIHMILDIENWLWISINSDLWCQNISKYFLWFTNSIDLVKNFERNWEGRLILRKANLHFLDSLEIPSPNDHLKRIFFFLL